jgi:hypothetical protein
MIGLSVEQISGVLGCDRAVRVCRATSMETVMNHRMGERKEDDNQNCNPNERDNS